MRRSFDSKLHLFKIDTKRIGDNWFGVILHDFLSLSKQLRVSINRRIGLIFLLIVLVFNVALSQTAIPTVNLTNFKWGLKDSATARVIIPAKYDYIMDFHNGIAITRLNNLYGFIDQNGKEIAEPLFERCYWLNDSLLKVQKSDLYGLVTPSMQVVMPFVFHTLDAFGNYLLVNNGEKSGIIDLNGNIIIPFQYDEILPEHSWWRGNYLDSAYIRVKNKDKMGVINYLNEFVIRTGFESVDFWPNNQFLISENNRCTLLDSKGDTLIPWGKYQLSDPPSERLIAAGTSDGFGYIDSAQNVIIPFIYQKAHGFQHGLGTVQKEGFWGLINKKNEVIIPFKYASPIFFYNGIARLEKRQNGISKFAYMNSKCEFLTDFGYDEGLLFEKNYTKVRINNKWGLLDNKGVEIIPVQFDKIAVRYGYVVVSTEEKYGLYNLKGDLILPATYSFVYPARDHPFIMVREGRNYGYVNHSGDVVIPFIYENARNFAYGRATVLINGESYEIDSLGNRIGD